ncbi:MAG: hypothetical protein J0I57_17295 [Hyphomicrobium sp.]|jgi:hypothetical protein|nr:hypothetical protein [Hyphomicrobium sp.]MBN9279368.1 hypothetical protein [Hyphomicrobium sp.]
MTGDFHVIGRGDEKRCDHHCIASDADEPDSRGRLAIDKAGIKRDGLVWGVPKGMPSVGVLLAQMIVAIVRRIEEL